jgi:hypothetical protein
LASAYHDGRKVEMKIIMKDVKEMDDNNHSNSRISLATGRLQQIKRTVDGFFPTLMMMMMKARGAERSATPAIISKR